ncbi:sigma-70 family RNA polymerase sigma factor [Cryobacterium sp. TMT1-21]|uniref:RNA polymerase sigma factor n=1 Tax=Cryobacterium shii TaxID=1259235 RepID=A0AAQ2HF50_9MICO|nr:MULTISPECIES: sigma-70 family RNA polymerase sigma factor [Cryobacterium]TFC46177.1 sigma-70 family RNA polymerase sigma factor [Cryobacterium shii]TFC81637.1 sigma-70 family RNA polymerase sigma factor [Cryobacterium sp. TmT2-59]TFD12514.1 sigma-70 family RNA polymerase sigma factor [Cryobacterium sp. TMT4-10]TFD13295.1 sigma-70 family RNA polymerase sigma factor [Cryobacterium sp. TMT1-21]TFD16704.1 sigma-70 family RNA polymerase sigma factor [Cryobacterium sp. TMT2-23]
MSSPVQATLSDKSESAAEPAQPLLHAAQSAATTTRLGRGPTDTFGFYLRKIGMVALLAAEEEVDLARRMEVGLFAAERLARGVADPDADRDLTWLARDGDRAKKRFIEANLRLVVSVAKQYSGRGIPIMDLVQDGNLGLLRAVEKFDFMTGYKFSTYGIWWIRQSIHRGMVGAARTIRLPVHTVEKLNKIKRIGRDLTGTLHREPTLAELAEACRTPIAEVRALLDYDLEPISFQAPLGEGLADISELIMDDDLPQPEEYAALALRRSDITFHLDALPTRERTILEARFGFNGDQPRTLDQIAAREGVTRERIRQIEKRALAMMRVPALELYLRE